MLAKLQWLFYTSSSQARNKKERGQTEEAKGYTTAAILCNVCSVLLGVGAIVGVSVYYGIKLNQYPYRYYNNYG